MQIGTVLFTYHRSVHTKKVLDALSVNDVLPEKLYIFQDGKCGTTNTEEWEKVNLLIQDIDWCETEVHVAEQNYGLSKSVTNGIHYVLQECDAVIVLEDDCVPYEQFMRFMVTALTDYADEKKVYSVSGYAWDIDLPDSQNDAYFNGRICSWGWGTWKDRWIQYEEDYRILARIKSDRSAKNRLQIWGGNMESMLTGNITGRCNSWAVFYGLKMIEKGGYCLSPYKQLVHNVGFDGSGVHGSILAENDSVRKMEYKEKFLWPKEVQSSKQCEEEFQFLFGKKNNEERLQSYNDFFLRWIHLLQNGKRIRLLDGMETSAAVWGKGKIFDSFWKEIRDQAEVRYIIESKPSSNEYHGIPVISLRELPDDIKTIIVIPFCDLEIIKRKVKRMRTDINVIGMNELVERQGW